MKRREYIQTLSIETYKYEAPESIGMSIWNNKNDVRQRERVYKIKRERITVARLCQMFLLILYIDIYSVSHVTGSLGDLSKGWNDQNKNIRTGPQKWARLRGNGRNKQYVKKMIWIWMSIILSKMWICMNIIWIRLLDSSDI